MKFAIYVFAAMLPSSLVAQTPTAALNTDLANSANVGTVITYSNPTSYTPPFTFAVGAYLNSSPNQLSSTGGSLFYSDSPEEVSSTGILYRDLLPAGSARVYLYHVNKIAGNAKVTAVLQNAGSSTANVIVTRKTLPTPSSNFLAVGKAASQEFFTSSNSPSSFTIAPGAAALLDATADSTVVANSQLLHSIHDYTSDQPLTVTALLLSSTADTLASFGSQPVLANDANQREGPFADTTRENATPLPYNTTDNIKRIRIADGPALNVDAPLAGTDAEAANAAKTLAGNYGVNYKVNVNVASGDGRRLALVVNPRAGGYAGYFKITTPVATAGQMAPVSSNVSLNTQAAVIARVEPVSTPRTLTIEFMPAGASSLPIEIGLVPYTGTSSELAVPVEVTHVAAE
jgi:hypothetical protein